MSDAATGTRPAVSEAVQRLMPAIEALSPDERAVVREYLDAMHANPGLTPGEWETAWDEECQRRLAAADRGEDDLMPADEFFRQLRERRP